jgi:hypothetical protein
MASAVRWQIKEQILQILNDYAPWVPEPEDAGLVNPIGKEAIVFRKTIAPERPDNVGHDGEILPGIIVSTPRHDSEMTYSQGTNLLDWVPMRFLIQFVDRDNRQKTGGEKTYWKWQELCWAIFSEGVEKFDRLEDGSIGQIVSIRVRYVDSVDPAYWVRHDCFIGGVLLEFEVLNERL